MTIRRSVVAGLSSLALASLAYSALAAPSAPAGFTAAARFGAATQQTPVTVSGTAASPLASCTADSVATQPGVNYANAEVEPYVAVNPTNPDNVVGVWQQDRWSNGSSRGNVVATSFDGGVTWSTVLSTKSSLCTGGTGANGGDLARATDPWLSFAPNGDLYLMSLALRTEVLTNTGLRATVDNALLVARSTDGGRTWSDPATLIREGCAHFNDKNSVTADPNDAEFVYAVWTRYSFPTPSAEPSCLGAVNARISADIPGAASFAAPGWFTRTTDGGRTWEQAREIVPVGQGVYTIDHQIVVLPTGAFVGELVDFFVLESVRANAHGARGPKVALTRSRDRGATWAREIVIDDVRFIGTRDPLTGAAVRTAFNLDAAVDPTTGTLYAVWVDGRFSVGLHADIAFAMSTDGGTTWTTPVKANRTPAVPDAANRQSFIPSVAVGPDGSVAVSYYDLRFNGTDASASEPLEADHFLARCPSPSADDPQRCATDWVETRLTPTSFDLRAAPRTPGLFIGDYMGLSALPDGFGAMFTQANSSADRATVYFAHVRCCNLR